MSLEKPGLGNAVKALAPNAEFSLTYTDENPDKIETIKYDNLHGDTQPTNEQVEAKYAELLTEYNNTDYKRNRAGEYPDWGTQLDYIYHNGLEKWKTDIVDPVKAKYPKPS